MDALIFTKFGVLFMIHVGLLFGLRKIAFFYRENFFFLNFFRRQTYDLSLNFIFLIGLTILTISFFAFEKSKFTFYVLNAAFLSVWFVELAVISGKRFFVPLFGDDLPKELSIFVGFILAMNGGYFTLMFIQRLFSSSSF